MRLQRALAAVVLLGLSVACGGQESTARTKVDTALSAIAQGPYVLRTQTATRGVVLGVELRVYDDYAHDVLVTRDGAALLREQTRDDAVTLQLLQPGAVKGLGLPASVATALRSGRPVLDPTGGLDPARAVEPGRDPVVVALHALEDLRRSLSESAGVTVFNPESLTYVASNDPFARPDKGKGERRYDVAALPFPRYAQVVTGAAAPGEAQLRRTALYLRGSGVRFVVREHAGDFAKALAASYGAQLKGDREQVDAAAFAALNAARKKQGLSPLFPFDLTGTLERLPSARPPVPPRAAAVGRLIALRHPWVVEGLTTP